METIYYLISVSVCVGCFYLVYLLLFRNYAAFSLNRAYLVAGILMSFVISLLDLSSVSPDFHVDATAVLPTLTLDEISLHADEISVPSRASGFPYVATLYWIGVSICGVRLLYVLGKIIALKSVCEIVMIG